MVRLAIIDGLVFSAVTAAMLFAILRINPEMMLNDYPRAIRRKFGPMSAKAKRQRNIAAVVMVAVNIAVVIWSLRRLDALVGGDVTVGDAFQHLLILFMVFNVVDLLLIDLPLVRWQPASIVLPGTEGMEEYRKFTPHVVGFVTGLGAIPVMSGVIAPIVARFM
jgi:hypothetical protein